MRKKSCLFVCFLAFIMMACGNTSQNVQQVPSYSPTPTGLLNNEEDMTAQEELSKPIRPFSHYVHISALPSHESL